MMLLTNCHGYQRLMCEEFAVMSKGFNLKRNPAMFMGFQFGKHHNCKYKLESSFNAIRAMISLFIA